MLNQSKIYILWYNTENKELLNFIKSNTNTANSIMDIKFEGHDSVSKTIILGSEYTDTHCTLHNVSFCRHYKEYMLFDIDCDEGILYIYAEEQGRDKFMNKHNIVSINLDDKNFAQKLAKETNIIQCLALYQKRNEAIDIVCEINSELSNIFDYKIEFIKGNERIMLILSPDGDTIFGKIGYFVNDELSSINLDDDSCWEFPAEKIGDILL